MFYLKRYENTINNICYESTIILENMKNARKLAWKDF